MPPAIQRPAAAADARIKALMDCVAAQLWRVSPSSWSSDCLTFLQLRLAALDVNASVETLEAYLSALDRFMAIAGTRHDVEAARLVWHEDAHECLQLDRYFVQYNCALAYVRAGQLAEAAARWAPIRGLASHASLTSLNMLERVWSQHFAAPGAALPACPLFRAALPFRLRSAPGILRERLADFADRELVGQLHSLNRHVRSVLTKCVLPCVVEAWRDPTNVPPFLLFMRQVITSEGGMSRLNADVERAVETVGDLEQQIRQCVAQTKPSMAAAAAAELMTLKKCVDASRVSTDVIAQKLALAGDLIEVIQAGELAIATFLGLKPNQKPPSLPPAAETDAVAEELEQLVAQMRQRLWARVEMAQSIEARVKAVDIDAAVLDFIAAEPAATQDWDIDALYPLFQQLAGQFGDDRTAVHAEVAQASGELELIARSYERFSRKGWGRIAVHERKALQQLMFSTFQFFDIQHNLRESNKYLSTLAKAVSSLNLRLVASPPSRVEWWPYLPPPINPPPPVNETSA